MWKHFRFREGSEKCCQLCWNNFKSLRSTTFPFISWIIYPPLSVNPLSGFIIHSVFHVLRILACNIKVSPGTQAVKHDELHCCRRLWQLIRNSREIFYISAPPPLFACGSHVYTLLRISACFTWLYVSLSLSSPFFFSLCFNALKNLRHSQLWSGC